MILFTIVLLGLAHSQTTTHYSGQTKTGIDFYLFGDYGWMGDTMQTANRTFKKLDDVLGSGNNETNPEDLLDFIIAAGDNLYPLDAAYPTEEEFDMMLSLFQKENL